MTERALQRLQHAGVTLVGVGVGAATDSSDGSRDGTGEGEYPCALSNACATLTGQIGFHTALYEARPGIARYLERYVRRSDGAGTGAEGVDLAAVVDAVASTDVKELFDQGTSNVMQKVSG